MRIEVRMGERLPPWYGVAWVDFARMMKVTYPVPLHLVARRARQWWVFWVKSSNMGWLHQRDLRIFEAGRRTGASIAEYEFNQRRAGGDE